MVLCIDEPQIQAIEGIAPVLPMRPGQIERRSRLYTCKDRHRSTAFLDQVEAAVPADLDVPLVLDNVAIPDGPSQALEAGFRRDQHCFFPHFSQAGGDPTNEAL